jgi:hypothetical protein
VALLVGAADEGGIGGAHVEACLAMSGSVRLSLGEMGDKDVSWVRVVTRLWDGRTQGRSEERL